jgi:hypothetical protein
MSGAYEQKDNQVYFHFQQMACHFDFPIWSNDHFLGDYQKAEGHATIFLCPIFTLLYLQETYGAFTPS